MDRAFYAGGLALLLAVSTSWGQESAASFLTGIRPEDLHYDKEYARRMSQAMGGPLVVPRPTIQKTVNPSSYFLPHLPQLSWPSWLPWSKSKSQPQVQPLTQQQQLLLRRRRSRDPLTGQ